MRKETQLLYFQKYIGKYGKTERLLWLGLALRERTDLGGLLGPLQSFLVKTPFWSGYSGYCAYSIRLVLRENLCSRLDSRYNSNAGWSF